MKEKEGKTKDSIEYLLEVISTTRRGDRINTSVARELNEVSASPEEGVRLIHAFIRIKQPELRAAIIKLTTEIADRGVLTTSAQN
jgi:hypothetical protein